MVRPCLNVNTAVPIAVLAPITEHKFWKLVYHSYRYDCCHALHLQLSSSSSSINITIVNYHHHCPSAPSSSFIIIIIITSKLKTFQIWHIFIKEQPSYIGHSCIWIYTLLIFSLNHFSYIFSWTNAKFEINSALPEKRRHSPERNCSLIRLSVAPIS